MANNDMRNLLESTNIATLFLDNSLRVKRFTSEMSLVSKLISSDVGRPITDIASGLFYPELTGDVKKVLRTLNTIEKQVKSDHGSWFKARILPYRTLDDKIDGVVITFIDVNEFKLSEEGLRHEKLGLEQRIIDQGAELAKTRNEAIAVIQQGRGEAAAAKDPQDP